MCISPPGVVHGNKTILQMYPYRLNLVARPYCYSHQLKDKNPLKNGLYLVKKRFNFYEVPRAFNKGKK